MDGSAAFKARAMEPPIRPRPIKPQTVEDLTDLLFRGFLKTEQHKASDSASGRQTFKSERLSAIGKRVGRIIMHLDFETVSIAGNSSQ